MTPERWRQIEAVFQQAADLETGERIAYLDEACCGDEELRAEVDSLLQSEGLISVAPAIEQAAQSVSGLGGLEGQRIGAYQILGPIGEGGMGTVYKAVRADGQFEQQVAIKVIRPGAAGAVQSRRFLEERSMLAQLQHPHIARLIDGGEHAGIPYLVMELVEGQRIDEYCRQWNLSVTEKLELFLQVCEAVQHAHAALIVHRDLKPSNIMVTPEGDPKLLDFGIATLLDKQKDATQTGWMMTPDYASPEQVRGEPITVASDVYSLGVVLYELLTGERPYKIENYAPAEIQRLVCTTEIVAPSDRVVGVTRLKRQLRGDLDNIILMALRKEPGRRYGSVAQFAEDVRRHLAGQTVIARPDTMTYRLSKFVGRNRVSIALASMLIFTLVTAGALVVREGVRSQRRFEEVRTLANSLLTEIDPEASKLFGSAKLRRLLVEKSLIYLDRLSAEAGGDVVLQKELGRAYHRIGDIYGHGRIESLGMNVESMESHLKGLAIEEPLLRKYPNDEELKRSMALGYAHVGDLHSRRGDGAAASKYLQLAYGLADRSDPKTYVGVRSSLNRAYLLEGRLQDAQRVSLEAIEVARSMDDPTYLILTCAFVAEIASYNGDHKRQLELLKEGIQASEKQIANGVVRNDVEVRYALLLMDLGQSLGSVDQPNDLKPCEAIVPLTKAVDLHNKFMEKGSKSTNILVTSTTARQHLSAAQAQCGDRRAVATAQISKQLYESNSKRRNPYGSYYLGYAHLMVGDLKQAERYLLEVSKDETYAMDLLAEVESRRGNTIKALEWLAKSRKQREPLLKPTNFLWKMDHYRQASNLLRAIQLGDRTPGMRERGLELLKVFDDSTAARSVIKLRRDLLAAQTH